MPFFYTTKTSRQKFKYLENENKRSFFRWNKKHFSLFLKGISVAKNCLRPKSSPSIVFLILLVDQDLTKKERTNCQTAQTCLVSPFLYISSSIYTHIHTHTHTHTNTHRYILTLLLIHSRHPLLTWDVGYRMKHWKRGGLRTCQVSGGGRVQQIVYTTCKCTVRCVRQVCGRRTKFWTPIQHTFYLFCFISFTLTLLSSFCWFFLKIIIYFSF